jgi:hypothetical protein
MGESPPCLLFLPVDARDRARIDGLLNQVFRAACRFNDQGLLFPFLHLKDLGTDFHTGAAADALLGIEVNSFTQVFLPDFSLVGFSWRSFYGSYRVARVILA